MPDICIYYSREDIKRVQELGKHLESQGWDVWWFDYNTPGEWDAIVEGKTKEAKCAIPVWTNFSVTEGKRVRNEAKFAKAHSVPIFQVRMDDVNLPIEFNYDNTTDIVGWNGENNHAGLEELVRRLNNLFGIQVGNIKRQSKINLFGKQIKLPCFVKSVSSHETQLNPEAALSIVGLFKDLDAVLVSAYDMYLRINEKEDDAKEQNRKKKQYEFLRAKLKEFRERDVLVILDSGNYEKARKEDLILTKECRDCEKKSFFWDKEKLDWVLRNVPYDCAFCYDNLKPSIDPTENAEDVISRLKGDFEDYLLPV